MAFFLVFIASLTALLTSFLALVPTGFNGVIPLTIFGSASLGSARRASYFGPMPGRGWPYDWIPPPSMVIGSVPPVLVFGGDDRAYAGLKVRNVGGRGTNPPPAVPSLVVSGPAAPSPAGTPDPWFTRPIWDAVPTATPLPDETPLPVETPPPFVASVDVEDFPPPPEAERQWLEDALWQLVWEILCQTETIVGILLIMANDHFKWNPAKQPVKQPVKVDPARKRNPGLRRARRRAVASLSSPLPPSPLPPSPLDSPTLAPDLSHPGYSLVKLGVSFVEQIEQTFQTWEVIRGLRMVCSMLDEELEAKKNAEQNFKTEIRYQGQQISQDAERIRLLEDKVANLQAQQRRARELEGEVARLRAQVGRAGELEVERLRMRPAAPIPQGPAAPTPRGPAAMTRGVPPPRGPWRGRGGRGGRGPRGA